MVVYSVYFPDLLIYILSCDDFQEEISKYIPCFYYKNPNITNFEQPMSTTVPHKLMKLCIFIDSKILKCTFVCTSIGRINNKELQKCLLDIHCPSIFDKNVVFDVSTSLLIQDTEMFYENIFRCPAGKTRTIVNL